MLGRPALLLAFAALAGAAAPPPLSRRAALTSSLLAASTCATTSPARPAFAASASPQQVLKSRAVYGSRVFRLQDASTATILEEQNVLTLFITGVYGSTADKATKKELEKLAKLALAAAKKGDSAAAQAAIKEFVALGQIRELDNIPGTYYNAKSPCDRAGLQCGYQYKGYLGSRMED